MKSELAQQQEFNWDCIKNGVAEGQRHAALNMYMDELVSQGYRGYKLMTAIAIWNKLNTPPLRPEEIVSSIYHSDIDSSALDDEWLTIPGFHGTWKIIVCKGNQYESKVSHCGDLRCLTCGDLVRRDWISHLVNVTKGQDLYMVQINSKALAAKLNAICEAKAEYVQIRTRQASQNWECLTIIVNKHIDSATQISENTLEEVLESAIPEQFHGMRVLWCGYISVFTSTAWRMTLDPADPTARLVLRTTLPVFFQKEVAITLGAEPCGHSKWQSPGGTNQVKWESRFVQGLRECEKGIRDSGGDLWALDDYCRLLYSHHDES